MKMWTFQILNIKTKKDDGTQAKIIITQDNMILKIYSSIRKV